MCKAIAVFDERLGKRHEGWAVYLTKSEDFTWWSDKVIKEKITAGELVNGLRVSEAGEVEMDTEFTTGLLAKTGLATFTPIQENDNVANKYYAIVKVNKGKEATTYELVTNRFGHETVSEDRLKAMLSLVSVGGATLDENGAVVLHPGVDVVEATTAIQEGQKEKEKGEGLKEGTRKEAGQK